jgi:hypothetical protein
MNSNYSYWLPEKKEAPAIRAFLASNYLSRDIVFDSTEKICWRRINLPIRMDAPTGLEWRDPVITLKPHDSPILTGKYEGHVMREDPMAVTLLRLSDLMNDPDEYDETFLKPSSDAYSFAMSILEKCKDKTPQSIIATSPASIGDGGIYLQWETNTGSIQLIVPPEPRHAYLYFRKGSEKRIIKEAISEELVELMISIA